ncbi:hypothetical protein [Nocardiopsis sp. NPDC006938]|uniref:hypothetical protein n=1 Tax=Nocardiopsis sp. NPDC006938 TaxID=3364337 RepID=UPI00367A2E43
MTTTDARVVLLPHPAPTEVPGSPGWYVDTRTPRLVRVRKTARRTATGDAPAPETVLRWLPEVQRVLVTPDDLGSVAQVHYQVAVGADVRTVTAQQLRTGEVWDHYPAAVGVGTRQVRDVLHNVVRLLGAEAPRIRATTRTGWHTDPEFPDQRVFVRHDGTTVPAGRPIALVYTPDAQVATLAAPYPHTPDAATVRAHLAEIAHHGGWAPLVALGVGARALAQSIRPVTAALVITGSPGIGKTSCTTLARGLVLRHAFPPPPTVRVMGDTLAHLEMRLDSDADVPSLADDVALTGESGGAESSEVITKLDRIIRSVGNGAGMRGRQRRDPSESQSMRFVRSPVMITAQTMPQVQASLMRRTVMMHLQEGDARPQWWADLGEDGVRHADRVGPSVRALGDAIITRLAQAQGQEATRVVDAADAAALRVLAAHMDRLMPDWDGAALGMGQVVRSAAQMLGGLVLIAQAAQLGADQARSLVDYAAAQLAPSLVHQHAQTHDRASRTDDLGTAVGDVVRTALVAGRAHVCGPDGTPGARVPGRPDSELGISRVSGQPHGRGVALYWLPDRSAVGVSGASLHILTEASRDVRVAGMTARSLPGALLRAGAALPSPQRSQGKNAGTTRTWISALQDRVALVMLRPEVIWPDLGDAEDGTAPDAPRASVGPVGPAPVLDSPAADSTPGGAQEEPQQAPQEEVTPAAAVSVPVAQQEPQQAPQDQEGPEETEGAAVLALGVDGDQIIADTGQCWDLEWGAEGMGRFLDRIAGLMPEGGTVAVTAEMARTVGYPAKAWAAPKKITSRTKRPEAYDQAEGAGWSGSAAGIGAYTSWWGQGRPSITIAVLDWMDDRRVSGAGLLSTQDTPLQAALVLGGYRARVGAAYRMTAGTTGVARLREMTPRAVTWLWDGGSTPAAVAPWERDASSARPLTATDTGRRWAHCLDARVMYLAAMSTAECSAAAQIYAGRVRWNPKRAGYWRIPWRADGYRVAEGAPPLVVGHADDDGMVAVTTPTLILVAQHHPTVVQEPLDAYLSPVKAPAVRAMRDYAEMLRDAYFGIPEDTEDEEAQRIRGAVKATIRETVGMLRRGTRFMHRPDFHHTVVATGRANLNRKIIRAHEMSGEWPMLVRTDEVWYSSDSPTPDGLGIWYPAVKGMARQDAPAYPKGEGLGTYDHKDTMSMDAFRAKFAKELTKQ